MRIKYVRHFITIGIMTAILMLSGGTAYAEQNPGSNVGQRNGTYVRLENLTSIIYQKIHQRGRLSRIRVLWQRLMGFGG